MPLKQYDYDLNAALYDEISLGGEAESVEMNRFLNRLFRRRKVKTVIDMTCGTGAQAVGLARYGYRVLASDRNDSMLALARAKCRGLGIRFRKGDIRSSRFGSFDAAIAIFNAIGHLDKKEFGLALRNVNANLELGGVFVFDIFNLGFMIAGGFRNYEYIELARQVGDRKVVRFNDNTLDPGRGVMTVKQRTYVQDRFDEPRLRKERWEMQLYTADELRALLDSAGFGRVRFLGGPSEPFEEDTSLSIVTVAKKLKAL